MIFKRKSHPRPEQGKRKEESYHTRPKYSLLVKVLIFVGVCTLLYFFITLVLIPVLDLLTPSGQPSGG